MSQTISQVELLVQLFHIQTGPEKRGREGREPFLMHEATVPSLIRRNNTHMIGYRPTIAPSPLMGEGRGEGPIGNENWDIWADLDENGSLTTRYVRGDAIDSLFARIDAAGTTAHYFVDYLGSIRHQTDGAGVLKNTIAYNGFGHITSETDPTFSDRYTFAGRERDVETGFYYNRARYYNPEVGRWVYHS